MSCNYFIKAVPVNLLCSTVCRGWVNEVGLTGPRNPESYLVSDGILGPFSIKILLLNDTKYMLS